MSCLGHVVFSQQHKVTKTDASSERNCMLGIRIPERSGPQQEPYDGNAQECQLDIHMPMLMCVKFNPKL